MDSLDWKILEAISTEKNMSRVAKRLFISQPAVSYRLSQIEKEFHTALFIRGNRGVTLTDAGKRLNLYSHKMLNYENEIRKVVCKPANDCTGNIHIGITSSHLSQLILPQLKIFCTSYPNIDVTLDIHSSSKLYQMMQNNELMISIIRGNSFNAWKGESYIVKKSPLLIISKDPISDEYLLNHPFISNTSKLPIDQQIDEWSRNHFKEPFKAAQVHVSGDSLTRIALVKNGFGWTIIPSDRLLDASGLYNQTLLNSNGCPYYFYTQLIYNKEACLFDMYQYYIDNFIQYFDSKSVDTLM